LCELSGGKRRASRAIVLKLYVSWVERAFNVSPPVAIRIQQELTLALRTSAVLLVAVVAACAPPPEPRSVLDFMEDGLARDGVLARCNGDHDETLSEIECDNARRAAATLAAEADRGRNQDLERESERKLVALRERAERQAAVERAAAAAARAAAEAAYEARWRDPSGPRTAPAGEPAAAPAFGAPVGPLMPSMTESTLFDVYAEETDPLGRRSLEVAAAEPPANDLQIATPELELAELAIIPRPFRTDDTAVPQ
jgi:hypothetical protein